VETLKYDDIKEEVTLTKQMFNENEDNTGKRQQKRHKRR
jgi:hypothetical protein